MKTSGLEHFGLGNVASMVGLSKASLMEYVKLGAGATVSVTLGNLLLSKLTSQGKPLIPAEYSPYALALLGIIGGGIVKKKLDSDIGLGMVAGGVGVAVSELVTRFINPASTASVKAADSAEQVGYGPQFGSLGSGRAFAHGLAGLSLGAAPARALPQSTASSMLNGAAVAIEEAGAESLAGASVAIEDANFASALN